MRWGRSTLDQNQPSEPEWARMHSAPRPPLVAGGSSGGRVHEHLHAVFLRGPNRPSPYQGLAERVIALSATARHGYRNGEGRQRSIRAGAVNHDNILGPGKMGQRAADILFLAIRQQDWGKLIKYLQVHVRRTHGLD